MIGGKVRWKCLDCSWSTPENVGCVVMPWPNCPKCSGTRVEIRSPNLIDLIDPTVNFRALYWRFRAGKPE